MAAQVAHQCHLKTTLATVQAICLHGHIQNSKNEKKKKIGKTCTCGNHVLSWAPPSESLPIGTQGS